MSRSATIYETDVYGGPAKIPAGYEAGEFRLPKHGEIYLSAGQGVLTCHSGELVYGPRLIFHKLPTPADVYGCDPDAPKGYRKVEFRKLKVGEKVRWINRIIPTATPIDVEVSSSDLDSSRKGNGYVWIVEPIPAPAPAPKFKVGDRVRYKNWDGRIRKATVTGHDLGNKWGDTLLRWDDVGPGANNEADMELDNSPAPPCPAPSGFRYTGEYRTPGFADIYLTLYKSSVPAPPYRAAVCSDNYGFIGPKHILVRA